MGSPCRKKHRAMALRLPTRSARIGTAKRVKELTPNMVLTTRAPVAEGQSLSSDNIRQIDHDDGVSSTPPVVDANEVPEGEGAPGLLEKDGGPHTGERTALHRPDGCLRIGTQGPQPDLGRLVAEVADAALTGAVLPQCRAPRTPNASPAG